MRTKCIRAETLYGGGNLGATGAAPRKASDGIQKVRRKQKARAHHSEDSSKANKGDTTNHLGKIVAAEAQFERPYRSGGAAR